MQKATFLLKDALLPSKTNSDSNGDNGLADKNGTETSLCHKGQKLL